MNLFKYFQEFEKPFLEAKKPQLETMTQLKIFYFLTNIRISFSLNLTY